MGLLRRWFGPKYVPPSDTPITSEESTEAGFYTSTSTLVVYDLAALTHRRDDDVDWWADPAEEMLEINRRNLLIVGLGGDGFYDLDLAEVHGLTKKYSLHFPSGRVFIGPGEMLTGGGDEPAPEYGGTFLDFAPGDYEVGIERIGDQVRVGITRSTAFDNEVVEPILIP